MKKTSLENIAKIYNGNSINAKVKTEQYSKNIEGWHYIGTKDINYDGTINYNTGVIIPFESTKFKLAPANCVLVCSEGGSAGKKTAHNTKEICFGNKLYAIVNEKNLFNSKYVYYYTRYRDFFDQFKSLMNGIIGGVSSKKFGTIEIPLPTLAEQESIVQKIEELFSELDKGIEELTQAKARLKVYRQAVLKDAFEGKWDYDTIFNQSSMVTSGSRGWAKYYSTLGSKFIRIGNLTRETIKLDLSDIQYVCLPDSAEGTRSKLKIFDVLISITADLGSIAYIHDEIGDAYINQHIAVVRFHNPELARFYAYYLKSDLGNKDLLKNKRGAGKLGLGLEDIRKTKVPLIDKDSANKVVTEIESRLSVCDNIEQVINDSLKKAENLRQSILKKAFAGELV